MGKSYFEKLRDPRWQKKRLEILERDGFRCVNCGDGEHELHVHHLVYRRNGEPWDTPDKYLETLCKLCHDARTEFDSFEIFQIRKRPTKGVLAGGKLKWWMESAAECETVEEYYNG